jgi:hypothetical protein
MKNLVAVCCLVLLGGTTTAYAQSAKPRALDPLMSELTKVKWISNHDPGFGSPNDFYRLSKEFVKSHTPADFRRMVNHPNPLVRAMGLLGLAKTAKDESFMLLLSHSNDETVVRLQRGCLASEITMGEFAKSLLIDPDFLDP